MKKYRVIIDQTHWYAFEVEACSSESAAKEAFQSFLSGEAPIKTSAADSHGKLEFSTITEITE